jgi:predicted dinucleotide-binding enzyme
MSTLALIGSGEMGGTVARLAVAAGLDVVLSNSRGSKTLSGLLPAHALRRVVPRSLLRPVDESEQATSREPRR